MLQRFAPYGRADGLLRIACMLHYAVWALRCAGRPREYPEHPVCEYREYPVCEYAEYPVCEYPEYGRATW